MKIGAYLASVGCIHNFSLVGSVLTTYGAGGVLTGVKDLATLEFHQACSGNLDFTGVSFYTPSATQAWLFFIKDMVTIRSKIGMGFRYDDVVHVTDSSISCEIGDILSSSDTLALWWTIEQGATDISGQAFDFASTMVFSQEELGTGYFTFCSQFVTTDQKNDGYKIIQSNTRQLSDFEEKLNWNQRANDIMRDLGNFEWGTSAIKLRDWYRGYDLEFAKPTEKIALAQLNLGMKSQNIMNQSLDSINRNLVKMSKDVLDQKLGGGISSENSPELVEILGKINDNLSCEYGGEVFSLPAVILKLINTLNIY